MERAAEVGARVLLDATHGIPFVPLGDLAERIDYGLCSAYKHLLSPRGVAFMALRPEHIGEPPADPRQLAVERRAVCPLLRRAAGRLAPDAAMYDVSLAWFPCGRGVVSLELLAVVGGGRARGSARLARDLAEGLGLAWGGASLVCMPVEDRGRAGEAAIAGRVGIDLPLETFDDLSDSTPFLVNLKPSGAYLMEDFFYAGGLPAVLRQIEDLLDLDTITVSGDTLGRDIESARILDERVIRPRADPLSSQGSLTVLRGNLCPDGAVLKRSAATASLLEHEGRAVVFRSIKDMHERIDDPGLDIRPDDVLVLQNAGPIGAPGMPEAGHLPIPTRLLREGVTDMVRISDARMSGTGFGTVVLHVAPEAAAGGLLGLVEDGDRISLDTANRRLDLLVSDDTIAERRGRRPATAPSVRRGYRGLYERTILQADKGCDLDFLVGHSPVEVAGVTHG